MKQEATEDNKSDASHKLAELCLLGKESPFAMTQPPFLPNPDQEHFQWESVSKALASETTRGAQSPEAEKLRVPPQLTWSDRAPPRKLSPE